MLIANPIYDTVFKYLMEDSRVARLIISTIIDAEIDELVFTPRERTAHIPSLGVTVFRLDFSAVIRTVEGERRNVLIELQKADGGEDVRRFRRYLAENYYERPTPFPGSHKTLTGECFGGTPAHDAKVVDKQTKAGPVPVKTDPPEKAILPIISIYILGETLPALKGYSAIKVKRRYLDAVTGEEITKRVPFIESLTHDSYVVQLSELNARRRNRLEQLLSLFEQVNMVEKQHLKEFTESLPKEFQPILERLIRAALDRRILEEMIVEDDVLTQWKEKERKFEQQLEEAKVREEEAKAREEEAKAREEEAKAREEEAKAREEEAKAREEVALAEIEELKRQLNLLDKKTTPKPTR